MPRISYVAKNFHNASLDIINEANQICAAYRNEGYDLTLRQLYYQFVSRDLIENSDKAYKRLGSIVNDARLAGMIDWTYIIDRTRNLAGEIWWEPPAEMVDTLAEGYQRRYWDTQPEYVEAWIEKDALVGVLQRACRSLQVPYFSCRGYTSQSEMWGAAQRIGEKMRQGKRVTILHLGDHDPSGIDMTRDIRDRMRLFIYSDWYNAHKERNMDAHFSAIKADIADRGAGFEVNRIALTMDQIEDINPPPNPAKLTDARAQEYVARYGYQSWELDALEPSYINELVRSEIGALIQWGLWDREVEKEEEEKTWISEAARFVRERMEDTEGEEG